MPPSPERGIFIHQVLEWAASSELTDKFNSHAVQMYIDGMRSRKFLKICTTRLLRIAVLSMLIYLSEKVYDEAWKHLVRLYDGKQAAIFAMKIIQDIGPIIKREELGLITGHLVVTMLAAKKVPQAEQALLTMVQTQDFQHLSPLLNGIRYLVEAAKT